MPELNDVAPVLTEKAHAAVRKNIRLHLPVCQNDEEALLWGAILATRRKRGGTDRNSKS